MIFKNRKVFIVYLVTLIVIIVIGAIIFERQLQEQAREDKKDYPELKHTEELSAVVTSKRCEMGQALIKFSDGSRYWLVHSRNYSYTPEYLCQFLTIGDSLLKKANSDTLYILRSNNEFHFVLGEDIDEP